MPVRKSEAEWTGSLREGHGTMTVGRESRGRRFTFASRFEEGEGTNPEELVAAAHAGCFSMQLAGLLTAAKHAPKRIHTIARVHIDVGAAGAEISGVNLETHAQVPGIDRETFMELAERAKEICPVSKALRSLKITLKATLA